MGELAVEQTSAMIAGLDPDTLPAQTWPDAWRRQCGHFGRRRHTRLRPGRSSSPAVRGTPRAERPARRRSHRPGQDGTLTEQAQRVVTFARRRSVPRFSYAISAGISIRASGAAMYQRFTIV